MHISEGVLSAPVLISGSLLALGGLAVGIKKLNTDHIALCGMLSAAFFVASLVHVPIGVGSAHLVLNGLLGVLLGWAAFPAIFAALLLQALLFQYGGLTTLGLNTFTMAGSAVCAWYVFKLIYQWRPNDSGLRIASFVGGLMGVFISSCLTALALAFTNEGFLHAAMILLLAHIPVMLIEGVITMFATGFIAKIQPQMLALPQH